jgi:hypothetical protein
LTNKNSSRSVSKVAKNRTYETKSPKANLWRKWESKKNEIKKILSVLALLGPVMVMYQYSTGQFGPAPVLRKCDFYQESETAYLVSSWLSESICFVVGHLVQVARSWTHLGIAFCEKQ